MKTSLITLIFILAFNSSAELPVRIMEILGNYHSKEAQMSDDYMANDLSEFNIIITPDSEVIVHFEEWDLEFEIDKELSFGDYDVTECDDVGCSGISEIEGKITFVKENGKEVPRAVVTMHFYADESEDIDCDEVDCDGLDYEDYWREWEETFTFKFQGSIDGQFPSFKPTEVSERWKNNMQECSKLVGHQMIKCSKMTQFNFNKEINEAELNKLNSFIGTRFKTNISKEQAISLIESHFEHELLLAKTFDFVNDSEKYSKIEANFLKMMNMMKYSRGDEIYVQMGYGYSWGAADKLEFLFINNQLQTAKRFQLFRRR